MLIYCGIVLAVMVFLNVFVYPLVFSPNMEEVEYSTFLNMLDNNQIATVEKNNTYIYFTEKTASCQIVFQGLQQENQTGYHRE